MFLEKAILLIRNLPSNNQGIKTTQTLRFTFYRCGISYRVWIFSRIKMKIIPIFHTFTCFLMTLKSKNWILTEFYSDIT